MALDDFYAFRRSLVEATIRDIVGPSQPDEVIEDDPITRYISGILFPRRHSAIDPSLDVDEVEEDDESAADPPVALANVRYPSSMGMTFAVDTKAASRISIRAQAAHYVPLEPEPAALAAATGGEPAPRRSGGRRRWRREPIIVSPLELDVSQPVIAQRQTIAEGLDLFCRVRPADSRGAAAVTVVLLNRKISPAGSGLMDADAFFQPQIEVAGADVADDPFVERPTRAIVGGDEELRSYRLLYRHAREFATGHGCSVQWTASGADPSRAASIRTTFAPEFEVPLADSNPGIRLTIAAMKSLAEAPREEIIAGLGALCDDYDKWIERRRGELDDVEAVLRAVGVGHLNVCVQALGRMRQGVTLLKGNDEAWDAFRLANRAMLRQRARTVWLRDGRPPGGPRESAEHQWRPFQLAFILLCLDGIANAGSADRDLVDLLWFPTGGGKTEAYLGLIAFTVFLRRLRRSDAGGVTAIMRYTLRLLTIQQFERATLLVCCCEAISTTAPD